MKGNTEVGDMAILSRTVLQRHEEKNIVHVVNLDKLIIKLL